MYPPRDETGFAQPNPVAEAFSRKALVYDAFGQDHPNLERMRRQVRAQVMAYLHPGDRILELNAGTGGDAAYFARQGFSVHAMDLSPGMVAQIQEKAASPDVAGRLTVQQCSFTDLNQVTNGPFQCIFSNMGGVNCVADLEEITRQFPRLLSPGGQVTWVVMPTLCLWELAAGLHGDWRLAGRRLQPGGVLANVEGVQFRTFYYTPAQVQAAFGPAFQLLALRGLSVFTPPADHKGFAHRYPRLYRLLCALDDRLAPHAPFNSWGDFFMMTLRYRPEAA